MKKIFIPAFTLSLFLAAHTGFAESYRMLRNYPDRIPLSFMDGQGKATGFETELMAEIIQRSKLDIREEFVPSIRYALQELREGKADLVVAAVSITEERKKEFDFSEVYLKSRPMIITTDADIKNFADLGDKTVGMIQNTVHERRIRAIQESEEQSGATLGQETIFLALKDMMQGKSKAIVGGEAYMSQIPELYEKYQLIAVFDDSIKEDHYAVAIKKGSDDLRQQIDAALAQMKADGTYERLLQKWYPKKS